MFDSPAKSSFDLVLWYIDKTLVSTSVKYPVSETLVDLVNPPTSSDLLVYSLLLQNTQTNKCPKPLDFDSLDPLFLPICA